MAQRISPHKFQAILNKDAHLPNMKRFTYSRDSADAASCRFYVVSQPASDELDSIADSMQAGSSYKQALSEHATQDNFFENYPGKRDPGAPSPYHLIAPLRALRLWAEDRNNAPSYGRRVFSAGHLYELLRVTYLLFVQERDNAVDSDAVILRHEQIFGDGASDRNCDRDILYQMYLICYTLADGSLVTRFNSKEKDDCNESRLKDLTKQHRGHRTETQYVDGGYYYLNETGESTLFHALPLHQGRRRPNEDNGQGWKQVTIRELQLNVPSSTEYWRGKTLVRVQAYKNWLWRGLGNGEQEHSRTDEVIADANDGNRDAAKILLSYCFEGDVMFGSSEASAWCRYTKEGYEQLDEYLTLRGAVLAMGMPLKTEDGDFVFPRAVGGCLGYLKLNNDGDVVVDWRVPTDGFTVLARQYRGFPGEARLVHQ